MINYKLTDTHCHITCDALYERIDEVMENAKEHHIVRMLVICTNFIEYERAEKLKQKGYALDIALGFHPNDLYSFQETDYHRLEELLKQKKIVAVGEIGLDYHWDDVEIADQKVGFIRQMELAKKYQRPILIHMREATEDTIGILREYAPCVGIMHCYSGSLETAKMVTKLGYYIAYGGPLTFKNAKGAPQVAKELPLDRLLIETDCPYLTPHPYRGKQNEPMYLEYTFQKLCEIKEMSEVEVAKQLEQNYQQLFYTTQEQ